MANYDYPGVCLSCSTEDNEIVAPDIDVMRERVRGVPETDYTLNIANNMTMALPDIFKDKETAYLAFDVVKGVIAMGLKNKDTVALHGLGTFTAEDGKVVFKADPALDATVAE